MPPKKVRFNDEVEIHEFEAFEEDSLSGDTEEYESESSQESPAASAKSSADNAEPLAKKSKTIEK